MRESMSPRLTSLRDRSELADKREFPLGTIGADPLATRSPLLRFSSLDSFCSSLFVVFRSGCSRILRAALSTSMIVVRDLQFSFSMDLDLLIGWFSENQISWNIHCLLQIQLVSASFCNES